MTAVASAGPPNPTPQAGASAAPSGAPGGVFAAFFGTIEVDGASATPVSGAAANVPGLLQGMLPAAAKALPALDAATSENGGDEQAADDSGGSTDPQTLPLIPLIALATGQPAPPAQSSPDSETPADKQIGGISATPVSLPAAKPAQVAAPPTSLPLPDTDTAPTGDQSRAPAQQTPPAPQKNTPPGANALPPPVAAQPIDDSAAAAMADDAPADPSDPRPHAAKKAATSAATSTPSSKPASDSGGTASAATAAPASSPTPATTATPDPTALPLTPNPDPAVKTVPLSNLAGLSQQAAVTAIGATIANEASGGTNRFVIRLDPPDLGRIDVRLHFDRDGELRARLVADRPDTVSLLTRDAGALERALNASGVRTADSGIDVSLRDSSGGFAQNSDTRGNDAPSPYQSSISAASPDYPASSTFIWVRPQAAAGRLDLTV